MYFWTMIDNDAGAVKFDKCSLVREKYEEDVAEHLYQEARKYICCYYSSSYGPDYSANAYVSSKEHKYARIKDENIVIKDGRFFGVYYDEPFGNKSLRGILLKDGGHIGKISESSSYRGSIIPEYSYSSEIFLAELPSSLPFPEQGTPFKDTGAKAIKNENE